MIINSSTYVENQQKEFALYVLQHRAIPAVTDGLKPAGRRVIWMARDGKKYKTATLAGLAMSLHPHSAPCGAIDTLAAPYGNNIPLFKGDGAFGTLIDPTSYGAARYTAVTISEFTKDVILRDIEIVPLIDNYDGTLKEPIHFLPLVPICLLNPTEGIAVGFATNILPRSLNNIIKCQINFLKNIQNSNKSLTPSFNPLNNTATDCDFDNSTYMFYGEYVQKDVNTIVIKKLPYGQTHTKVINKLHDLIDQNYIVDFIDNSKDSIDIEVKFKKGILKSLSNNEIIKLTGLSIKHTENLNVLNFSGDGIWGTNPIDLLEKFTSWRLTWYINRYQRLKDLLVRDLIRYKDIDTAILNNVGGLSKKIQSRLELKDLLIQMNITNIDYIADLPIYRFTQDEYVKNRNKITETENIISDYDKLLTSEKARCTLYINELEQILDSYISGIYSN